MAVETVEYRVRRGDTLQSIAQAAGFPRRDWRRIYDANYNRALKSLRPDPDQIEPCDRLMLPRYNPEQVVDIGRRIQVVEQQLITIDREIPVIERNIGQLESEVQEAQDLSSRDLARRVTDLRNRADGLLDLSAAAADECSDAYSCMGAGAASMSLEAQARRLRTQARQLQRNIKKGETDGLRALQRMRVSLRDYGRARASISRNVTQLRGLYRGAAQRPY